MTATNPRSAPARADLARTHASPFDDLIRDASFFYLRECWHAESAVKIHRRGGRKQAGEMTGAFFRILSDQYINWLPVRDDTGAIVGRTHRVPRTTDEPDEFVMPAHEALKREKPDVPLSGFPEYRWLRETIAWRYLPCVCNCPDVVSHIAVRDRTTVDNVTSSVRAAARRAVMFLAAHDALPADLRGIPVRQGTKAAYRGNTFDVPTAAQLARLPRVYWPCGCTEISTDPECVEHDGRRLTAA